MSTEPNARCTRVHLLRWPNIGFYFITTLGVISYINWNLFHTSYTVDEHSICLLRGCLLKHTICGTHTQIIPRSPQLECLFSSKTAHFFTLDEAACFFHWSNMQIGLPTGRVSLVSLSTSTSTSTSLQALSFWGNWWKSSTWNYAFLMK